MADQKPALRPKGFKQGADVGQKMVKRIGFRALWPARPSISAHVGRHRAPTETGQQRKLAAPCEAAFRKPVKQEGDVIAFAGLVDLKRQAVGCNLARVNGYAHGANVDRAVMPQNPSRNSMM